MCCGSLPVLIPMAMCRGTSVLSAVCRCKCLGTTVPTHCQPPVFISTRCPPKKKHEEKKTTKPNQPTTTNNNKKKTNNNLNYVLIQKMIIITNCSISGGIHSTDFEFLSFQIAFHFSSPLLSSLLPLPYQFPLHPKHKAEKDCFPL